MKILLIDNFDSFTFNLVHYFETFDTNVEIVRYNAIDQIEIARFDAVVISPGSGLPKERIGLQDYIRQILGSIPILGVCLGHQALAEIFDAELYNMGTVKHGVKIKALKTKESTLFEGLPEAFNVGLYHSWSVKKSSVKNLKISLETENGEILAFENGDLKVYSVQFHPESILTDYGKKMIQNFIKSHRK